jgi:hypothetical protein
MISFQPNEKFYNENKGRNQSLFQKLFSKIKNNIFYNHIFLLKKSLTTKYLI